MMAGTSLARKAVRLPLRLIPNSAIVPILAGPLRGAKWIVGSQRHAFWLGIYESYLQQLLVRHVTPGSIFFDVGANVGLYSLLASKLVEDGKVVAFEPDPANVAFLKRHLILNRVANVTVLDCAITDKEGTGSFSDESTHAMGHLEVNGKLSVATATIDALLQRQAIPPPTHIKMDIEGEEFRALIGSGECFREYRPTLFLATHGVVVHQDCCQLLQSWSYRIEVISRECDDRAELFAVPANS